MSKSEVPTEMRIWTYSDTTGGLENNLKLNTGPLPQPNPNQHLIQVLAVGLNPVDYKASEAFIGRFAIKKPATPAFDIAGRIVTPAPGSDLKPGQLVYGAASANALAGGALAEYIVAPSETLTALPEPVSPLEAAGAPIAASTALDSLEPWIHAGSRVFINGGSGGVGTYGIQIAKIVGAHVTVSCSSRNVELVKSLGADGVLDYIKSPLLAQLQACPKFDHVVDNVFNDPGLYFQAHTYTTPTAAFVEVASGPSLSFARFAFTASLLPDFLGGGKRKFVVLVTGLKGGKLARLAEWMVEGKIRNVIDETFTMDEVVAAYKTLKTGRARGKIVVDVAGEN